jgi:hypothetical protein
VVTISYHTPWPGPLDPFYLHNPAQNLARTEYYNIPFVPYFWFDGISRVWDYIAYSFYESAYLLHADVPTEVTLTHTGLYTNASGEVELTVSATFGADLPEGDYRLHLALVENGIPWEAPNGQTVHEHVMRRMYPDAEGTALVLGDTYPQTIPVSVVFTLDEIYGPENCEVVYFLQENGSREVHQAGKVAVTALAPLTPAPDLAMSWELGTNYPNPFNPTTTIPLHVAQAGPVAVAIHAADGRLVKMLHRGTLAAGHHRFVWDGRDDQGVAAASGVYLVRASSGGRSVSSRALTLVK